MYYFRPYNADRVHEHRARTAQWEIHPGNPYSVSMYDAVHEDFAQRFPDGVSFPAPDRVRESRLPNLESLIQPVP